MLSYLLMTFSQYSDDKDPHGNLQTLVNQRIFLRWKSGCGSIIKLLRRRTHQPPIFE